VRDSPTYMQFVIVTIYYRDGAFTLNAKHALQ